MWTAEQKLSQLIFRSANNNDESILLSHIISKQLESTFQPLIDLIRFLKYEKIDISELLPKFTHLFEAFTVNFSSKDLIRSVIAEILNFVSTTDSSKRNIRQYLVNVVNLETNERQHGIYMKKVEQFTPSLDSYWLESYPPKTGTRVQVRVSRERWEPSIVPFRKSGWYTGSIKSRYTEDNVTFVSIEFDNTVNKGSQYRTGFGELNFEPNDDIEVKMLFDEDDVEDESSMDDDDDDSYDSHDPWGAWKLHKATNATDSESD